VKLKNGGIHIDVNPAEVDRYLRAGYVKDEKAAEAEKPVELEAITPAKAPRATRKAAKPKEGEL
jgi:hypothetical protein